MSGGDSGIKKNKAKRAESDVLEKEWVTKDGGPCGINKRHPSTALTHLKELSLWGEMTLSH